VSLIIEQLPVGSRFPRKNLKLKGFPGLWRPLLVLEGNWSIVPSGSDASVASHHFQLSRGAVGSDSAEQAQGMSVLLGQLADAMAVELGKSA